MRVVRLQKHRARNLKNSPDSQQSAHLLASNALLYLDFS